MPCLCFSIITLKHFPTHPLLHNSCWSNGTVKESDNHYTCMPRQVLHLHFHSLLNYKPRISATVSCTELALPGEMRVKCWMTWHVLRDFIAYSWSLHLQTSRTSRKTSDFSTRSLGLNAIYWH
jgi:hypothetical protein